MLERLVHRSLLAAACVAAVGLTACEPTNQGYAPERSMLLVWENASPELPASIASGMVPNAPV